jgi:hypothetical protein
MCIPPQAALDCAKQPLARAFDGVGDRPGRHVGGGALGARAFGRHRAGGEHDMVDLRLLGGERAPCGVELACRPAAVPQRVVDLRAELFQPRGDGVLAGEGLGVLLGDDDEETVVR